MKKKYFTFLYIPDTNSEPKTLKIPRYTLYLCCVLVLACLAATGWVSYRYASKIRDAYRISSLEKENALLREKVDAFSLQVSSLNQQILQNFNFQKKARLLANLEELNDDITEVGVGGLEFSYGQSLSILDDNTKSKIGMIGRDIDKLLRQAKLQRESYQEILGSLSEGKKRLDSTPSIRPVPYGFISSRFGRRMNPFTGRLAWHRGVDYSVRLGTPIYATANGVISHAGRWSNFGNVVEITHGYGYVTRYAHVSKVLVRKGQHVKRGDLIARVGSTGKSTAAHLHYEVLIEGKHKNPLAYVYPSQVNPN